MGLATPLQSVKFWMTQKQFWWLNAHVNQNLCFSLCNAFDTSEQTSVLITLHTHARAGGFVIESDVHIYMFKVQNRTLAI